nr:MAG TPA: hypothetical protein [Caudoviricetes sp.]
MFGMLSMLNTSDEKYEEKDLPPSLGWMAGL